MQVFPIYNQNNDFFFQFVNYKSISYDEIRPNQFRTDFGHSGHSKASAPFNKKLYH